MGCAARCPFRTRPLEPGDPALQELAPLGDGSYSWAWDVDAAGDAVGYSTNIRPIRSPSSTPPIGLFGSGSALELPDLGGQNTQFPEGYGYANAINAAGDRIVGKSLAGGWDHRRNRLGAECQ